MSQSCFSLGFLSQNSLWKLSTFRGYKGIYSRVYEECKKSCFNQTGHSSDSTSQLEQVVNLSCKLIAWPDWKFCPVVLQLAWFFNSPTCFTLMPLLATCQPWDPVTKPYWVHTLEIFFTFSYTLPLHKPHLNIGFLNVELQAKLVRNKANKMVD